MLQSILLNFLLETTADSQTKNVFPELSERSPAPQLSARDLLRALVYEAAQEMLMQRAEAEAEAEAEAQQQQEEEEEEQGSLSINNCDSLWEMDWEAGYIF